MELIIVTIALIALAFWQREPFLMLVCSMVAIGFGVYWITVNPGFLYIIEGVAAVGVGIYMIIETAIQYFKR